MKKNTLSMGVIVLFGTYVIFARYQDISAYFLKNNNTNTDLVNKNTKTVATITTSPIDLTSTEPTASTVTPKKIQKTTCVYVPATYGDEDDDNGGGVAGHYKCTTTTVDQIASSSNTNTSSSTVSPTNRTPTMMGNRPTTTMGSPMMNRIWNNGTYTGDVVDAYYGNVQVSVTISSDKMLSISFLDYPQDRRTSLQKSNYAMPILKQEAISAQSANVNTVSSVTYTSEAFIKSLSSALAQAKI